MSNTPPTRLALVGRDDEVAITTEVSQDQLVKFTWTTRIDSGQLGGAATPMATSVETAARAGPPVAAWSRACAAISSSIWR